MKSISLFLLSLAASISAYAVSDAPIWMRYPAISPDGKQIVFSYQGDLYKVAAKGGVAEPLTLHDAYDFSPVWSHDGKYIAFASDRYGNFDVFVTPSDGGHAERLTFHSADDIPSDFTVDDQSVIFSSSRTDDVMNMQFPTGALSELYRVPVQGGRVRQVLTVPAEKARFNDPGDLLVYQDKKGYEDQFRKHHTSTVTRDVWTYEPGSDKYIKVTSFAGEDRNPVFVHGSGAIYYLSEEKGAMNVFRRDLKPGATARQLTSFKNHPVRHLSASKENLLCFSWYGGLYTLKEGGEPFHVPVVIKSSERYNETSIVPVNGHITDFDLSPNGKEVAFIYRGEVFVTSVEGSMTKRITNTPEQERTVSFSPDGRALLYASERDSSWNIYQTKITRDEDPSFFLSTLLKEEPVVVTGKETFQPAWSPDGKEVAFLDERTTLKVINLETKKVRTVMPGNLNYSYSDGDQYYRWSPDGKWFFVEFLQPEQWISQVGMVNADSGNAVHNMTRSGYSNWRPKWMMDGKMLMWFSDRDGMKNDASWGAQDDVYGMFLTRDAYDKFRLNKEEYDMLNYEKKKEKIDKKVGGKKKKEDGNGIPDSLMIKIDWNGLYDRKVRLSVNSAGISDALLSKDGEKLYSLASFEKGNDLWETNLRTHETKLLIKIGSRAGHMIMDKKGQSIFVLAGGRILKLDVKGKKSSPLKMNAEMVLNARAERQYMFEHMWRQVLKKFYVKDLQGTDWEFYREQYKPFLASINNDRDFAEMMSELLGELNASHTGCRYRHNEPGGDETAALGLFYDNSYEGNGLRIAEVMDKSPVISEDSRIKKGTIIEKIDGIPIEAGMNYYPLLNRKAGKYVLLSLHDPQSGQRWVEKVKAISRGQEYQLRYERWVKKCRALVDELSGGRIGYVHVRGMDTRSYRTVYEEVLGRNAGKEALIVDTRFNGGGWLHDDLATFLNGKVYMTFLPRGQVLGREPQFKWAKPSVVVMGEGNYSDAHMFPYTYKALGIGKLVGMPVPGTGTAVWWERLQDPDLVFGIPQIGMMGNDGNFLENHQLEPDIKVADDPGKVTKGEDQQLEAAVKELLREVKNE